MEGSKIATKSGSAPACALLLALLLLLGLSSSSVASSTTELGAQAATSQENGTVPAVVTTGVPAEKIDSDQVATEEEASQATPEELSASTDSNTAPDGADKDDALIVRFLDIGQGDCALITCGGHSLLIDGGPPEASSKVYSVLRRLEISNIDYVVATHPDADHIGGLSGALTASTCGAFFCSTETSDTSTFDNLLTRVRGQGLSVRVPSAGDVLFLGGATVTFIGPVKAIPNSENNNSLVVRISFGSNTFLFLGDAEEEEETSMVSAGVNLSADVLKVAHHGSSSSSSLAFLRKVQPSYAVISVGDNDYGHPTAATIGRLQSVGAEILRTDEVGSVIMTSDGSSISVTSTKGNIDV